MKAVKKLMKIINDNQNEQEDEQEYTTKDEKGYTVTSKVKRPEGTRYYKSSSPSLAFAMKMNNFKKNNNPSDSTAANTLTKAELEKLNKK
jgi:hypothetical protein